jgi:hypothetical protein
VALVWGTQGQNSNLAWGSQESVAPTSAITNVSGTFTPGGTLTITHTGLGTLTTATLGGQSLTITDGASNPSTVDIPADIALRREDTYTLTIGDGTSTASQISNTLTTEAGSTATNFNGVVPDPAETESFYELILNDGVGTPAIDDQLIWTNNTNMTVDAQWQPDIIPYTSDVTGTYRFWDNSAGTLSAPQAYSIEQTDTAPDAFTLTDQTDVALSTQIESNVITVTGINAAASIIISGTGAEYRVSTDGGTTFGAYTSTGGTVDVDDQVQVRLTSSASNSTESTATLTIGGVSDTWNVTTEALSPTGTIAETLADFTSSATGAATASGTITESLESFTLTATGSLIQTLTGSITETLEDTTSSISADVEVGGIAFNVLEDTESTASGVVGSPLLGSISETTEDFTSAGFGGIGQILFGFVSEDLDSVSSSAAGELTVSGTLAETLDEHTSTASGSSFVSGSLTETLEDQTATAAGSAFIGGSINESTDDMTSSAAGTIVVVVLGSLEEDTDNVTSTFVAEVIGNGNLEGSVEDFESVISALARIPGTISETSEDFTGALSGGVIIAGTVDTDTGDVNSSTAGLIIQDIVATGTPTTADMTVVSTGELGVGSMIQLAITQMHTWLPDNNVLSNDQMEAILIPLFDSLGAENYPEILCKALERAALANKAKATTSYGLTKEKVYNAEYMYSTGGKSPAELWDDYIRSLSEICPIFGYNKPVSLGIRVGVADTVEANPYCKKKPDSLY